MSTLLSAGKVLAQRYEILNLVGRGGMGAVYRARDLRLPTATWAVKEMWADELAPDEQVEARQLFEREAHLLAGLVHPALPRVSDYFSEDGRQYLVMEFIDGETLDRRVERQGPIAVANAVRWGQQLCEALTYLHERPQPIIFRDVKPPNVMITGGGSGVKIIDFGIARIYAAGKSSDTVAFGTPGYAAPEQYGRAQSDVRADVFGLGATLHFMLTAVDPSDHPFRFEPPSALNNSVPASLDALVLRAVALDPNDRFARIEDMRQALERVAFSAPTQRARGASTVELPATPPGLAAALPASNGSTSASPATAPHAAPSASPNPGPSALPQHLSPSASPNPGPSALPLHLSPAAPPSADVPQIAPTTTTRPSQVALPASTVSPQAPPPPPSAPRFDLPALSFGHVRRGETRRVNVRMHGDVDGVLVSSERKWLRAEPHKLRGRDPVAQLVLYSGPLREGRAHHAIVTLRTRRGNIQLPVSVDIEPSRLSLAGVLVAALLTAGTLIPALGLGFAVLLAMQYFSCPLDERPALRPFTLAATVFSACNLALVTAAFFVLRAWPQWSHWLPWGR